MFVYFDFDILFINAKVTSLIVSNNLQEVFEILIKFKTFLETHTC